MHRRDGDGTSCFCDQRERRVTCDWSKMLEGGKVLGQDWGEGGDGIAGMGGQVR